MAHVDDYRNKNTKFEWKINTAGTYAEVLHCTAKTVPSPEAVVEDITDLQSVCVVEENQINDYGNLELEILYMDDDTVHLAMEAGVGAVDDCYIQMTLPSGVTVVYQGNAKSFKDSGGGAKNRQKRKFMMHCNTAPVVTPAA